MTYLDQETINEINKLGGIQAIALSHPHYYSTQVEWAESFDSPVYIHEDDKDWVQRPSEKIVFWSGEQKEIADGVTLHRLGGHFKGGAILHWKNNDGIALTGDIIQVVADRMWVSFMYSYPNLIPLPAKKVEEISRELEGLKFVRLYTAFHRVVEENADQLVQRSAKRYIEALEGSLFFT
jgi:glyoxylase-like metal-dependent hydrolase (beta-lactamase superfamily II)